MAGIFMQPACFFRKLAWEQCGPIRNDLHYCMCFAFWLEISQSYEFLTIKDDIAFAHVHKNAKTTAQRKNLFAEIAIVLAQQPDGFASARRVAMDLADGKLVSNDLSGKEMLRQLSLKVLSRIGLGWLRD